MTVTEDGRQVQEAPRDLVAEECLLGAMLLARQAIEAAMDVVRPADFYKPAHVHIFDAILSLYNSGVPVDPITVADSLNRVGMLDSIGGHGTLTALMASAPAISNAARYGGIIAELATCRRMVGLGGEIAMLGYSMPEDMEEARRQVEAMVFSLNDHRGATTVRPMAEMVDEILAEWEARFEDGGGLTGVPTGYLDLDELTRGLQPGTLTVVGARPAMGKALALDTLLPTPTGWITMGDVQPGDQLLDEQGRPCTVTAATSVQHGRECFLITFDDGSSLVADADHQWSVYDLPAWKSKRGRHDRLVGGPPLRPGLARDQSSRWKEPRVVTTRQMLDEGVTAGRDRRPNWYVPLAGPIDGPASDLPVDPYVLGCWLGDGRTSGSEMTIGDQDIAHFTAEFNAVGYPLEWRREIQYATVPVPGRGKGYLGYRGPWRVLTRELQRVGLLGWPNVARKHVPMIYLRGSAKHRLALLQGLMDTDGCVTNRNGTAELCLANRGLLEQAREVVCSLGDKPGQIRHRTIRLDDGRECEAWRFCWTPHGEVFRLERKLAALNVGRSGRTNGKYARRTVKSITPVTSVPVRCVTVDAPSSLYLAGESMIPTHNTSWMGGAAVHAAMQRPVYVWEGEMSKEELVARTLTSESRVDSNRVRTGRLNADDWEKLFLTKDGVRNLQLRIDDDPNVSVADLRSRVMRFMREMGDLAIVYLDYAQLMTPAGSRRSGNRSEEVGMIARDLKILGREIEVPIVLLAQVNRGVEQRADKRPMMSDLKESGGLEENADNVIFLYRDEVYNPESEHKGIAECIVAKHRAGPLGLVKLCWLGQYTRFANMARA